MFSSVLHVPFCILGLYGNCYVIYLMSALILHSLYCKRKFIKILYEFFMLITSIMILDFESPYTSYLLNCINSLLVETRQSCSTNHDKYFPSSKCRYIQMLRLVYCQLLLNSCQFSLLKGLREY